MDIPTKIAGVEADIAEVKGKLRNTVPRLDGETSEGLNNLLLSLNQQLAQLYTRLPQPSTSGKPLDVMISPTRLPLNSLTFSSFFLSQRFFARFARFRW